MAMDTDVARVAAALRAPGLRYRSFGNEPVRAAIGEPPSVAADATDADPIAPETPDSAPMSEPAASVLDPAIDPDATVAAAPFTALQVAEVPATTHEPAILPVPSSISMLDAAMDALRGTVPNQPPVVSSAAQLPVTILATPAPEPSPLADAATDHPASPMLLDLGAYAAAEPEGLLGGAWRYAPPTAAPRPPSSFSLLDSLGTAPADTTMRPVVPVVPKPGAAVGLLASIMPDAAKAPMRQRLPAAVAPAPRPPAPRGAAASSSPALMPAAAVTLPLAEVFARLAAPSAVGAVRPRGDSPAPAPLS